MIDKTKTTQRKYFGTDGIRGKVGQHPITPEFVLKLGWAVGKIFNDISMKEKGEKCNVLIGKDTRISGYVFESAIQAGLLSAGANISLVGPLPTPAIAYLTRTFNIDVGVVISASHNPFDDNGIKFFSHQGHKIDDMYEEKIEKLMEKQMETVPSAAFGKAARISDATGRYVEFCKGVLPFGSDLSAYKIVLDCANGATYNAAPKVFSELGAKIFVVGNDPDGININEECGSTNPHILQAKVLENRADFGIAFDGDGDRVVMVDHEGQILDGDDLLYIIAQHRHSNSITCPGVVGTVMTNFGLEEKFKDIGIPFHRAQVGDRYVIAEMLERNWPLGGEASGHVICAEKSTTGDGIITSLHAIVAMMHHNNGKSSFAQLRKEWRHYPSYHIKVSLKNKKYQETKEIKEALAKYQSSLKGRIILRPSGTEPIVRISVESQDPHKNRDIADELSTIVKRNLVD